MKGELLRAREKIPQIADLESSYTVHEGCQESKPSARELPKRNAWLLNQIRKGYMDLRARASMLGLNARARTYSMQVETHILKIRF